MSCFGWTDKKIINYNYWGEKWKTFNSRWRSLLKLFVKHVNSLIYYEIYNYLYHLGIYNLKSFCMRKHRIVICGCFNSLRRPAIIFYWVVDWWYKYDFISWKEPGCGEEELILMVMLPILWKQNKLCSLMGILLHLFRYCFLWVWHEPVILYDCDSWNVGCKLVLAGFSWRSLHLS